MPRARARSRASTSLKTRVTSQSRPLPKTKRASTPTWRSQLHRWRLRFLPGIPRILAYEGLFVLSWLAIAATIWLVRSQHLQIFPSVLGQDSQITADGVYQAINQQRTQQGVSTLKWNDTLAQAAQAKANDMIAKDYWAHTSPEGKDPWTFIDGTGYQYRVAGENLARNFTSTSSMVDAWLKSPTHRANLLHTAYQETGIAAVTGKMNGKETVLVVQMFGAPVARTSAAATGADNPSLAAEPRLVGEVPSTPENFTQWIFPVTGPAVQPAVLGITAEITPLNLYRFGMLAVLGVTLGLLVLDSFHPRHRSAKKRHPLLLPSKHFIHVALLIATLITVGMAEVGALL